MRRRIQVEAEKPQFCVTTGITFAQADAWFGNTVQDLKLDLIYPRDNTRKYPCVVWICGGAWIQMDRSAHLAYLSVLAHQGFVVASVEYRTSNEAKFPAPLQDVKAGIRYLRAHADRFNIDPDRIGVMGESAGGYLTCMAALATDPVYDVGENLEYSSAVQAMKELPGNQIDLLFLDIQMPELNGLEFSKMVAPRTRIVFTTAFGQYAIDGYRVNALDYLLKPISYVDFLQAANKALQWFELVQKPEEVDSIFVKSDYKLVQVELKKILYIEGLKDYIKIYTEDAPKPILSLMSMKSMEELLPPARFMRVHRSFIVQKDKIRIIDRGRIVFDKTYIPVSDSYKQTFQTFLDERS